MFLCASDEMTLGTTELQLRYYQIIVIISDGIKVKIALLSKTNPHNFISTDKLDL